MESGSGRQRNSVPDWFMGLVWGIVAMQIAGASALPFASFHAGNPAMFIVFGGTLALFSAPALGGFLSLFILRGRRAGIATRMIEWTQLYITAAGTAVLITLLTIAWIQRRT